MVYFPNGKINLGLRILGKRPDGYHDLETVFYPVAVKDGLEIVEGEDDVTFTQSGNPVGGNPENNLCIKAYRLLKNDFPSLPPCRIHLHKKIPERAGLAGGSSDGSSTLLLLNRKFALGISEEELIRYALRLGSDCPFFILNRPAHALGRGEILKPLPLDLSSFSILIVNPGIAIETREAFAHISPQEDNRLLLEEAMRKPVESWKDHVVNDFENYAFTKHPEIGALKNSLYEAGALYASMSGSGSSVYGIFKKRVPTGIPEAYFQKWV